jgi:uncharacterized protein YneF (UPF0154 family)
MTFWDVFIPVLALVVGLAAGFFAGIFYVRKQMEKMQNDPKLMQKLAKEMGLNINKRQMQQVQRMMKNRKLK